MLVRGGKSAVVAEGVGITNIKRIYIGLGRQEVVEEAKDYYQEKGSQGVFS